MGTSSIRRESGVREFTYTGLGRVRVMLSKIGGIMAAILFTSLAGFMAIGMVVEGAFYSTIVCLAVWTLIFGWTLSSFFFNLYSTVWLSDDGIAIRFFFRPIFIPWDEIVDVRVAFPAFLGYVVRARRITPLHRIYGWIYAQSLLPCFLIGRGIQNRDELLREIRLGIGRAR